jgi:hypothetical protein
MKIKIKRCAGDSGLENFLNNELDYKGFRPEVIIIGITQDRGCYTVIYKDYNEK